jgi:hypothetical protein
MDGGASSHIEDSCQEEETGGKHRSVGESDGRRDATKSIQYRTITRLASLNWDSPIRRKVVAHVSCASPAMQVLTGAQQRDVLLARTEAATQRK